MRIFTPQFTMKVVVIVVAIIISNLIMKTMGII